MGKAKKAEVVDCDTHFWQPLHLWEKFLDKEHRAPVTAFVDQLNASLKNNARVKLLSESATGKRYDEIGDTAEERLEHMDRESIDVQIIFPGPDPARVATIPDPATAAAACRAANRWNAEFAAAAPDRLKPMMVLPMRYPDKALEEMRYAVDTLGLKSVFVAPTPPPERRWSDPALDPLWGAMEAAGVVVCVHEFTQHVAGYPGVARATYSHSYQMMYHCHHTVEAQLALMDLIVGGVLERFPKLQVGFVEAHTAWLPGWLAQMDSLGGWLAGNKRGKKGEREMSLYPTEFFRRQCFIASFPDDAWIAEVVKYIGEENVVLCTDYPHPGTSHKVIETFAESYPGFSESARKKMLGGNAARIFGLNA